MNVTFFLETKNEYTEHLVDTLTPFIYEGLSSFYNEAVTVTEESGVKNKVLIVFQKLLQTIEEWNKLKIDEETNRIKQNSGTAEILDDLVKAVIKANIILLTYSNNVSTVIAQTFYNNFETSLLVHRCYIECAKDAHNNPFLFYHDVEPMEQKRNQMLIEKNIQSAIIRGIRKILPISLILKEYLANSVNIIYEPPKVELVGESRDLLMIAGPVPLNPVEPQPALPVSPPEPGLENKVMGLVNKDIGKSDRDRVKALMQLEKALNSIENSNRCSVKKSDKKPNAAANPDKKSDQMKGGKKDESKSPEKDKRDQRDQKDKHKHNRLLDSDKKKYSPNKNLNKSDRAVIDIQVGSASESESASSSGDSRTQSVTSMSEKHNVKDVKRRRDESSEQSDSSKPKRRSYIEEYGTPTDSVRQRKNYRK